MRRAYDLPSHAIALHFARKERPVSWKGVEHWTRLNERTWLCTLSSAQLAAYVRSLARRAVDFAGKPVTPEFLQDCRLDAARALERGTAPQETQDDDESGRGDRAPRPAA